MFNRISIAWLIKKIPKKPSYKNADTITVYMKRSILFIAVAICMLTISCRAGRGCPSNGKNVGAEKILSGDPNAIKAMKKAGKFKS